jgi:hypothetical protein
MAGPSPGSSGTCFPGPLRARASLAPTQGHGRLRHENFVVHTHPVVRGSSDHLAIDIRNAGDRTEAAMDLSGQVTFYNRHGIVDNPPDPVINDLGYVVGHRSLSRR